MKFTIDTEAKKVTLLETISLKEIDKIKKIIGEDWREWSIEQEIKVIDGQTIFIPYKEYLPSYPIYPLTPTWINPYAPTITTGQNGFIVNATKEMIESVSYTTNCN
jgi:hypothetical protein